MSVISFPNTSASVAAYRQANADAYNAALAQASRQPSHVMSAIGGQKDETLKPLTRTQAISSLELLKRTVDPEPGGDYALYWNNLHAATGAMPPLVPRGINSQSIRCLPFSGFSEDSINLAATTAFRYAPTPYAFDRPGLFVTGAVGAGLGGDSVASPTFQVALEAPSTIAVAQYTAVATSPAPVLAAVTQTQYVNTTMADEGYVSRVDLASPDLQQANITCAEFSGGFALIKVTTSNAAISSVSIAGQNQTRGLGFHTLRTGQYETTVSNPGTTYTDTVEDLVRMTGNKAFCNDVDFDFNVAACTLGLLSDVVDYDQVVSGADQTIERFYAMPIIPPSANVMPLTPNASGAISAVGANLAIWQEPVSHYSSGIGEVGGHWNSAQLIGANWQTTVAPFAIQDILPANGTWIGWSSVGGTRICRCATNMAQTMMAGMPQIEVNRTDAAAGGSVTVQISQKLFYNMIAKPSDPNWTMARPICKATTSLTEEIRGASAQAGGKGLTAEQAVADSKSNSNAVSLAIGAEPAVAAYTARAGAAIDDQPQKPQRVGLSPPVKYSPGSALNVIAGKAAAAAKGLFAMGKSFLGSQAGRQLGQKYGPIALEAASRKAESKYGSFAGEAAEAAGGEVLSALGF